MNECDRFAELISALIDGELSAEEEAELRAHMAQCPDCAAMYEAFSAVGDALRAQDVPDTLHDGIMAKVRAAEAAGRTQRILVRLRPILAAAACLIVLVGTVLALGSTLGRRATKSETAAVPASGSMNTSTTAASGAADAPKAEAEEAPAFESKMAVAAAPKDAPSLDALQTAEEPMAPQATAAATNEAITADAAVPESAAELAFTLRVEELTAQGLVGVVTDAGSQTLFAEGERVTVLTDGIDTGGLAQNQTLEVLIAADAQPENGAIRPIALISTE